MASWVAAALAFSLAAAFSSFVYLRREPAVPGRSAALALRTISLGLLLWLLIAPDLRLGGGAAATSGSWVGLDASRSMTLAGPLPDEERLASGTRALSFGAEAGATAQGSTPQASGSRLAPLVRRAAESGVPRLEVWTDLRIADGGEALALAEAAGMGLQVRDVGRELTSTGIAAISAPAFAAPGDAVEVLVDVTATEAAAGQRARVVLFGDRIPMDSTDISLLGAGQVLTVTLKPQVSESAAAVAPSASDEITPPAVVWSARVILLEGEDEASWDNVRHAVTHLEAGPGGIEFITAQPDWEPRTLVPLMAEVSALPTTAWLRLPEGEWLQMGTRERLADQGLADRLAAARLVVVQGPLLGLPERVARAALAARRRLVFVADSADGEALGLRLQRLPDAEWYPDLSSPSALGSTLSDLDLATIPPLQDAWGAVTGPDDMLQGLRAAPPGGQAQPVLLLHDEGLERRTVLALASDFWRWGTRTGDVKEAYRRLFAGSVGWLLQLPQRPGEGVLGPRMRVSQASSAVPWRGDGSVNGPVEVSWVDEQGVQVSRVDTLIFDEAGLAQTPGLPAGIWAWQARVLSATDSARTWRGRLPVDEADDELRWPRDTLLLRGVEAHQARLASARPPLRTAPWPWLLVMVLLAAEWIVRRRIGLR